ncbi:MAG: (2Fe-2S)-binding protein [Ignavibacteriaceae bacterium]|nr:(2Fe-2S)-binding protein [Ignavibacteriaceae bacterium]
MRQVFKINSKEKELQLNPGDTLLKALRDNGFTEVKCGCSEGECGACLVLLEDMPVNSCQVFALSVKDKEIKTVKGIGTLHYPHMLQKAFVDAGADQCGFCTPGMVIASYALLRKNPNPSKQEITEALDGNLCRCTGYVKIVQAVENAAKELSDSAKL